MKQTPTDNGKPSGTRAKAAKKSLSVRHIKPEPEILSSDGTDKASVEGLSPVAERLLQTATDMQQSPDLYERAFLARQLIQCTFPHKDPGNQPIWSRTNGNLTLSIRPFYDEEAGEHKYPYGTRPRLFLYWLITEVTVKGSRRIYLGKTYAEFMRKLGLNSSNGGPRSDANQLRDQIIRLLRATISFKQSLNRDGKTGDAWLDMQIGPEAVLWWNFDQEEQTSLFESYIELSEKFFNAITDRPVPLDLRALKALRKSPLYLDLYSLICHKTFIAAKQDATETIPWEGLENQMGSEYKNPRSFRHKVKAAIKQIQLVYPKMKVDFSEDGMHIHPAPLAIPETDQRKTLQEESSSVRTGRRRRILGK